jgi:hypothetical protein
MGILSTRSLDLAFDRLSRAATAGRTVARKKAAKVAAKAAVKAAKVAARTGKVAKATPRVSGPVAITTAASGKRTIKLGIERDSNFMYYIKNGAVWRVPRKRPGQPKGKKEKVQQFTSKDGLDYSKNLYYLDGNGDVVVAPRGRKK